VSTVEEIKRAAGNLSPEQRAELFRWLENSEDLRRLRYEQLKRDIAEGIEEADRGETAMLDIEAIKDAVHQGLNSSEQR
jgi:hypothetical protein